jgi:hypothetical protein
MGQPKSMQEYTERFHANQKITGYGIDTTMHMPCPFCAAPEWMVYRIIDSETAMVEGAVCSECNRGAAMEFQVNTPSNKQFEVVQTAGEPQPDWLQPMMRRRGS